MGDLRDYITNSDRDSKYTEQDMHAINTKFTETMLALENFLRSIFTCSSTNAVDIIDNILQTRGVFIDT